VKQIAMQDSAAHNICCKIFIQWRLHHFLCWQKIHSGYTENLTKQQRRKIHNKTPLRTTNVQTVADVVSQCVKNGLHQFDFCQSKSQGQCT